MSESRPLSRGSPAEAFSKRPPPWRASLPWAARRTMSALAAAIATVAANRRTRCGVRMRLQLPRNVLLVATVREGRMVNVRSNENMPYPAYERICNSGFGHPKRLYDFNRVKYPLKRARGASKEPHVENRGSDEWERHFLGRGRPAHRRGHSIQHRQLRMRIQPASCLGRQLRSGCSGDRSRGNVVREHERHAQRSTCASTTAILHGIGKVTGGGWDFNQRNMSGDYRYAKTLFVWDSNPPNSQPHNWHFCIEAKDAGANLVVIDPTYTDCRLPGDEVGAHQARNRSCPRHGHDERDHRRDWVDRDFLRQQDLRPAARARRQRPFPAQHRFRRGGAEELPGVPVRRLRSSWRHRKSGQDSQRRRHCHLRGVGSGHQHPRRFARNEESGHRGPLRNQRGEGDHGIHPAQRTNGRMHPRMGRKPSPKFPPTPSWSLRACTLATRHPPSMPAITCTTTAARWACVGDACGDHGEHRQEAAPPSGTSAKQAVSQPRARSVPDRPHRTTATTYRGLR